MKNFYLLIYIILHISIPISSGGGISGIPYNAYKPYEGQILNLCQFGIYPIWLPKNHKYLFVTDELEFFSFTILNKKKERVVTALIEVDMNLYYLRVKNSPNPRISYNKSDTRVIIDTSLKEGTAIKNMIEYTYLIMRYVNFSKNSDEYKRFINNCNYRPKNKNKREVCEYTRPGSKRKPCIPSLIVIYIYVKPEYEEWFKKNFYVIPGDYKE